MSASRLRGDPYRPRQHEYAHHIDALLSMVAHGLLLVAAYYFFSHRPQTQTTERRVQSTARAADTAAASRRAQTLGEIEQALAESAGEPPPRPSAPVTTPEAALREARARYAAILERDREARARELAALLDIPIEQARARSKSEMPPLPPMPETAAATAAQLAMLEAEARAALTRRADAVRARGDQLASVSTSGDGGRGGGAGAALAPLQTALERFDIVAEPPRRAALTASGRPAQVPAVDAGPLKTGVGRSIGTQGPYVTRLYIDTWYVLGPFDAQTDRPLEHPYPPESAVDLDGTYAGKRGQALRWRYLQAGEYPTYLPDPAENAIYYGYTELMLDRDMELWAWIGADDDARVWVDERLIWEGGTGNKPWFFNDARAMTREIAERNLSEDKVKLRLRAGRHRVLFKLHNGIEVMFFSLVLSDASASGAAASSTASGSTAAP